MAKIIVWNVVTLDGYVDGVKPWDLPWHDLIWSEDLEKLSLEQLHSASGLIFGRATYEGMKGYWIPATGDIADWMNRLPKFVASSTLTEGEWNATILSRETVVAALTKAKAEAAGDYYVFGSANFLQTLIAANLIDEYRIGIAPVLLGDGKPLFPQGTHPSSLRLTKVQPIQKGGVILYYSTI